MKRKVALILAVVMLFTMLVPMQVFAAGADQELTKAINKAKEVFDIPTTYNNFESNMYQDGDRTIWNLNWNSKDPMEGSISVGVDDLGNIRSYHSYKPYDYSQRVLPKFSRKEAIVKAEAFIKKVNPKLVTKIKLREDNYQPLMSYSYYFNFSRVENDITYDNNNVSVEINAQSGDVQSYYYNWDDTLVFPDPKDIISLEDAQKAWAEKLGLKLIYMHSNENGNITVYSAYVQSGMYNNVIDAKTGEILDMGYGYYGGPYYGGMAYEMAMKSNMTMDQAGAPALTPEEMEAVEGLSGLMSKEAAEKAVRAITELGITESFVLGYANLYKDWNSKKDYMWNFDFNRQQTKEDSEYRNIHVRVDAKTGELRSFYTYDMMQDKSTDVTLDKDQSMALAEDFLKKINPDKFAQVKFADQQQDYYYPMTDSKPTRYYFSYNREVNGIEFNGNSIHVQVNAVTGTIMSLDINWFDATFPAVDKVISSADAVEKLFEQVGLELSYKPKYPSTEEAMKVMPRPTQVKPEIKLVYSLKQNKPSIIDANTGALLDYNGKPYKEVKPVEYTDIEGHYAQNQIMTLAEFGISLAGTEFKPDEAITQKDFFRLLSKSLNYNMYRNPGEVDEDKDVDAMYNFLIREGVVKKDEKSPEATVTREDSVKFVIRALKYDKVADIQGIFKLEFEDAASIKPELVGYVAIAQGLKIVQGSDGKFNPADTLKRGQAAIIIYNYLQR